MTVAGLPWWALAVALALAFAVGVLAGRRHALRSTCPERSHALEAQRERQALDLHDAVVQGLVRVSWALEAGAPEHARTAVDATLSEAQAMVSDLLEAHPDGPGFGPGSLRHTV